MRRTSHLALLALLSSCWPWGPGDGAARAQAGPDAAQQQQEAGEARERAAIARFLAVVEKTPRRGTALDRVYGYHVERGTLDAFLKTYQDRAAADPVDGAAWMILGLVESQRGRDALAVAALRKAEAARPEDALPAYYLGQSLVLVGQPDDAAQAFERALARKPNRADSLEIFQSLGRVYQRAHRNEQALAVWSRLERQFPDDPRVQEQIAAALAEESQPDQALPRYEALAKKARDKFRQVQFQIDAADLKVRLNRSSDALADFEALLGRLDPDSWLSREVRRKIEEVFNRTDDQAGLAAYYERWIKKTPDDVEAMARLGRSLAGQGRLAEARGWYEKAVGLAPTRRDLRSALIEQLLNERKFAEAASQYEAIARTDPGNPDVIREWGKVVLRDPSRPEAERKKAASAVWRKLIDARPDDPATIVQVADLSRQAELNDEAIALYNRAIALAPDAPQYAEYLGEFHHRLKRTPEALATWGKIAEGKRRNARTVGRLAEVLSGFGYKPEALAASAEAARLDSGDFDLQLRYADLLQAGERLDDERAQLELAARAVTGPEQSEAVLERQIRNEQATGTLGARSDALRAELEAGKDASAERWRRLARRLEVDGKPSEAIAVARRGLALDPKGVPLLALIARVDEGLGNLAGAADTLRTLAAIDRRARTEYLTGVARLESRLGRKDAALKAGRDLLAAAPGQIDNHQFFAELCFGLGQVDEGLDALRRAVRLNESDPKAINAFAETLAAQFRTEEAIEMFWRGFEKAPDLESRLATIGRLTALYLQRNQFDRLIARLERQGREADRQREMAMCLAQAYSASGDYATARTELERLLSANPRDTKLLNQLSLLAEAEGDSAVAAKYQKQLVEIAPTDEGSARLAQLYLQANEVADAEAIWTRMASGGEPESFRVLMAVDSLLGQNRREVVLGITENLLRKQTGNWEALYREGAALAGLNRPDDAAKRFRAILDLKGTDDTQGSLARARKRMGNRPGDPAAAAQAPANAYAPAKTFPLQDRLTRVYVIRSAAGIEVRTGTSSVWSPDDFGQARMAALGWLYQLASKAGKQDELVADLRLARDKAPSDPRPHWDLYYLQVLRMEFGDTFEAALPLAGADPTNPSAQFALLNSLPVRAKNGQSAIYQAAEKGDGTPPLPAEQLDRVLAAFRALRSRQPDWIHAAILTATAEELKRGGRPEAIDAFYKDAVASASDADSAASVLRLAAERGDVDGVIQLFDRHERLRGNKPLPANNLLYSNYGGYYTLASSPADSIGRAMLARADAKADPDVLRLLDHYLAEARRPERFSQRARAVPMANAAALANGRPSQFQVWTAKTPRFAQVGYPTPNPYLDLAAIQVLRNAYELYKRDDLVSDLVAHLAASLKDPSDPVKVYAHLALSAIRWWQDDKDEALRELTAASALAKSDPDLILGLAELRAQRDEPGEALKLADSFEPLDQRALQRREILALRLSVLLGDVGRARKGAERLFGLRLDADTQVQLAAQMHQLGMHELAEAVLGRARRRAGGNSAALVALMLQYQQQGKAEVAVQVAHQVLRRNPPKAASINMRDDPNDARREAFGVLARSGKIREMIARVEAQVARTPGASQLHQALADYYKAAGEKDKFKAELDALVKTRPDDSKLRIQVATELSSSADYAAAVEQYKAALKLEPSLFGSYYYEIQQAFRQAGKFDDLVEFFEQTDLRLLGRYHVVAQVTSAVLRDKAKRDRGLRLFRRAWEAFPTQRAYLMSYMGDEEFMNLPEMYEYVHESVLPRPSRSSVTPWAGVDDYNRYLPDGRVGSMAGLLIASAERGGKLDSLTAEVRAAEAKFPSWRGGRVLRALALSRRGRADEARSILAPLFDPKAEVTPPAITRLVVGSELEPVAELRPLALSIQEGAIGDEETSRIMFQSDPSQRLVALYRMAGRDEDARRELIRFAHQPNTGGYQASVAAYYRIMDCPTIAAKLREIGYPADAARLCDEILADREMFELAAPYIVGERWPDQIRAELARDLDALTPRALGATLKAQLAGAGRSAPEGQALDPILLVYPRELDRAVVVSLLDEAIRASATDPSGSAELRRALDALASARPRDLSVALARATAAVASGPADEAASALAAVARLLEATPLEAVPAGERANSRQRLQAAGQLGLWPLAREAARRPEFADRARALAARAMEAAARQSDPAWSLAMLRESGRDALARGDRAGAEGAWARMLPLVLGQDGRAAPTRAGAVPVSTLDRFEQAEALAKMAARHGLFDLSIRAAVEPLRGGPPVVPIQVGASARQGINNPGEGSKDQAITRAVGLRLAEAGSAWEAGHVPATQVYEALRAVVLPDGRPSEVFANPRPIVAAAEPEPPAGVSTLLVRWAIRADRLDDLRRRLEARKAEPMARPGAMAILAQLDAARGDGAEASRGIDALAALMDQDKLRSTVELGCLVALPALDQPATHAAAASLIEKGVATLQAAGAESEAGRLRVALARDQFAAGKADDARGTLRAHLEALQQGSASGQSRARMTGASYTTRRENDKAVADELARGGQWDEALEALGRYADARPSAGEPFSASQGFAAVAVARHLSGLPPRDRYDRLKAWTLPAEGRPSARFLVAFAPWDVPPEAFGRFRPFDATLGVVSYADLLIAAAAEAGTLDDLAGQVRAQAEKKVENAEALNVLVAIARGKGAEVEGSLRTLLAEWSKKDPAANVNVNANSRFGVAPRPNSFPPAEYAQVRAALADPGLAELGLALAAKLPARLGDPVMADHLRLDSAASLAVSEGAKGVVPAGDPGLAWWMPTAHRVASARSRGAIPPWWVADGEHIHRRVGPSLPPEPIGQLGEGPKAVPDTLAFAVPLAGRFELSMDLIGAGVAVGYGGTLVDPIRGVIAGSADTSPSFNRFQVGPAKPNAGTLPFANPGGINRLTVRVEPGSVAYSINGHLAFTDRDPSPASPWLTLGGSGDGGATFRGLRLAGSPEIPREVRLIRGDRLDGWLADTYAESRPDRPIRPDGRPRATLPGVEPPSTTDADWSAVDGEIRGRRAPAPGRHGASQSRLAYARPLRPGESVSYEFFHEPDAVAVHPALGGLAFLLDPAGVRLHWMTDGPDSEATGLGPANAVDDPSSRRGPTPLPLKAGDWNRARLALVGRTVEVELNGVKVCERDVEPGNDRTFSLYRDKDRTAARVRDVVLRGDWPLELPPSALANPAEVLADASAADRRARRALIGDRALGLDAPRVVREAEALPPDRQFDALAAWVLPGDDRPGFRMAGAFAPADPAAPSEAPLIPWPADEIQPWFHTGGTFDAPALALVRAAKGANRLDELAARVEGARPTTDLDRRGRLAFLAAIEAARGRVAQAKAALEALRPLAEALEPDAPESDHWPELVALAGVVGVEGLEASARPLADRLAREPADDEPRPLTETFRLHAVRLAASLGWPVAPTLGREPAFRAPAWLGADGSTARGRGAGDPLPVWEARDGALAHRPGHDGDRVTLRTPIRGDFAATAEVTGREPILFAYAGVAVGISPDGKDVVVSRGDAKPVRSNLVPALALDDGPRRVRLSVEAGTLALAIDGRTIYEQGVSPQADPWLSIRQSAAGAGTIRDVRLEGRPAVLDQVDLSKRPDLDSWQVDPDEATETAEISPWDRKGDEIFGRRDPERAEAKVESLLRYRRPLAEDGEISYEFFHDPAQGIAVHPALDRLVLLVEPGGVRLHRLTDGRHDRSGLGPDVAADEPEARRGATSLPLKAGDWNRATLAVSGNSMSLKINDVVVFERRIEVATPRTFGLFHYVGESEVRVRNVVHRGHWPRSIPADLGFGPAAKPGP